MKYDVVIIGAGILGCLTARELMRYRLSVLVVDKAADIAEGATKANTGVLYAGFHARGGSLKGISCVRGNRMHESLCKELDVPMEYTGSLFVAFHEEGLEKIRDKMKKGKKNGVPEMRMISGEEAREKQPGLSKRVIGAMYCPTTGIISPFSLVLAAAENALAGGAGFQFDTEVLAVGGDEKGGYVLHTSKGDIRSSYVVNASGEGAAQVEHFVRERDLIIRPKSGQFFIFDAPSPVRYVIYQAEENGEKGTLLAPTTDGQMIAGPTSYEVPGFEHTETTRQGHDHIRRVTRKILPEVDFGNVIAAFAGVRANIDNVPKEEKDFVVRRSAPHFVSALGIKNPGMTASPYLAQMIIRLLAEHGLRCEPDPDFDPIHRFQPLFLKADKGLQKKLLADDPSYGHVICKCEGITEGDIRHVLRSPLPPRTINGLKKRLRISMGRCQGAFCIPETVDLLSRQWQVSPDQICKGRPGSMYCTGRVRP